MLSAAELAAVYGKDASERPHSIKATKALNADELAEVYGRMVIGASPEAANRSGGGGSSAARTDNKRTLASSGPKSKGQGLKLGAPNLSKDALVSVVQRRQERFDALLAKQNAALAGLPQEPIQVTMPDGKVLSKTAWVDSPLSIAESISKQFAGKMVVAKVKYSRRLQGLGTVVAADEMDEDADAHDEASGFELWDMARPLEGDCELKLVPFDDPEGQETFWHSSSHVLGGALEQMYGAQLTHGPPTSGGFFYDSYMGSQVVLSDDFGKVEAKAKELSKAKHPFVRLVLSKEDALELFADNPFKVHTIQTKVPDGSLTTAYKCGPLVDLCRGPHLPHTGRVEAFAVVKNSSAYFLGQANCDSLQRVYGISFPDSKLLKKWKQFQEEAQKRDHRRIGTEQELFFFHELSPGSCFFLPHGTRMYNALVQFIRAHYWGSGAKTDRIYHEVITPNMYNMNLWVTSGHAAKYKENMFVFDIEKQEFGLKPMNCPGHCLMFRHKARSYRELPLRFADFGVLHRNELSGALTGLTRVRRFQQDDAHIYCSVGQIRSEVIGVLELIRSVYKIFGMTFSLCLSTRPETKIGDDGLWDRAEKLMEEALNDFGEPWKLNPGDGAFYGPKIDVRVYDALERPHQCATVQLDFNLPNRFDLSYTGQGAEAKESLTDSSSDAERALAANNKLRPVMIHRAVLGSVERMIAILTEHYAGKWPLWLSPRQLVIVPVTKEQLAYAEELRAFFHGAGFHVDVDESLNKLPKMILNAQKAQYNYILVVGRTEVEAKAVNVRLRTGVELGIQHRDEFLAHIQAEKAAYGVGFEVQGAPAAEAPAKK